MAQTVKNLFAMQVTRVRSQSWEDPLEEGVATHPSILAWGIPWTEEPGGIQAIGLQSWTRLKGLGTHAQMVKDTSGLRWFYCLPQRTDISQVKGVGAFLCVGKRKQLGSLKFFLSHPSNHLRVCLSRYTESVNIANSCLNTEVHLGHWPQRTNLCRVSKTLFAALCVQGQAQQAATLS